MSPHVTGIRDERDQRPRPRKWFRAVCSCGWEATSPRLTRQAAERDVAAHHAANEAARRWGLSS